MKPVIRMSAALLACSAVLFADGPSDNLPTSVRRIPPPGIRISDGDRTELSEGVAKLGRDIEALRNDLKGKESLLEFLPDIQIFHKAVDWALRYDEFYKTNEVQTAQSLLILGADRIRSLHEGHTPWLGATGLVVRAYRSKIDGSIQPYGLVVPDSYRPGSAHKYRLDCWFHGRGETLTELDFINGRLRSRGEFAPPNAIVLHLYGRYCNANKFAGEIDLLEALDQVKRQYSIDENRIAVRGFSMGGAACWQFAVHYAGQWAAAAPGAGFSETADFLKVFQNEAVRPAWYEEKLWHWYDCTDYAVNLFNCPTVAYSGENDKQKQAAEMMAKALKAEGIELDHIIGPKTAHSYEPNAKQEINRRIDSIIAKGRDPVPRKIRFTTWTLRYPEMSWVKVNGLKEHWKQARVDAEIVDDHSIRVSTENVTSLTFQMPSGHCPLDMTRRPVVILDGRKIDASLVLSDRSWNANFFKSGSTWKAVEAFDQRGLAKRPGLQGPIDDAFMDSFLMVQPTGPPLNEKCSAWVAGEMEHAIDHWRRQFRGQAPVKRDDEVSEADIANNNLVLWGDPTSNKVLARIASRLPIQWTRDAVAAGGHRYGASHHIPLLIYPNPLNPSRYVVLNSGFTFREYDYLNNARQVPKLPDWAVLDVNVPVTARSPGGVVNAGFFDEQWRLKERTK
jgi:dienelactone hydrolase